MVQILSRPLPPPAVEQGQFKTMSMHGGALKVSTTARILPTLQRHSTIVRFGLLNGWRQIN